MSKNKDNKIETSGLENQVGHLLRRVFHKARNRMQVKISDMGLSPMQTAAMTSLGIKGPTSQNKLGRRIGMEPGNVHGLVDRLLKKGMITSNYIEDGPGLHILDLTEQGRDIVDKVIPLGAEANKETLAPLSSKEQEKFMEYLRRLL
ncbi:MAG: winged helix-turn-helix transcriptional regulator [Emcibacteraceae bacterium]|nr:winged helix-turn-helix transcriptional regulator [Emcibacteraceae bacterium]